MDGLKWDAVKSGIFSLERLRGWMRSMMEESKQKKNEKVKKDSHAEMIDSFFGSHNKKDVNSYSNNSNNFKETEQLIDKILEKKSSSTQQNSQVPTNNKRNKENPIDADRKTSNMKPTSNQIKDPKPTVTHYEKEEIFEIAKPKEQKKSERKHSSYFNEGKKKIETPSEKKTFSKKLKPKKQKNDEKIKFSLNLPKINFSFGRNKEKKKITNKQKTKTGQQQKNIFNSSKKSQPIKSSGRIHGISQLKDEEEKTIENKKKNENKNDKQKNQKKTLFKSTFKSLNLLKKKNDEKKDKSSKNKRLPQPTAEKKEGKDKESTQQQQESYQGNDTIDQEVIKLLKITDDLLGQLPEETIEKFSQSDDFTLYEKVMKKYDIIK